VSASKYTPSLTGKSVKDAKLLFVNVCLRKDATGRFLPVGLASVMTYFEQCGYNFSILDMDIESMEDDTVEEYLQSNTFDCILVGSIVTHYKWMKWFVRKAKELQPNSTVVVGNSVAGSIPEVFLNNAPADIVVTGEGEISAHQAVEAVRNGMELKEVEGITFRCGSGSIITTPPRKTGDIHDLPMINWDHFDVESYINRASYSANGVKETDDAPRPMPVITARGCVFKCTFCHYVFWNDPYRHRRPDHILNEIRRNIEKHGANFIAFWDDLSFASARQAEEFADSIIGSGLKFTWSAAVRVDVFSRNKLSDDEAVAVAKKMQQSGCRSVGFSLESGDQAIIEMMNKKIKTEDFFQTVRVFRAADIAVNTSVVFGYPIETRETIRRTFEMCYEAQTYPSIGFLMPLPSTGMYEYARKNGYIPDEDAYLDSITERQDICLNMTKMTDEEILEEIKVGAMKLNELLQLGLDEGRLIRTGRPQGDKGKTTDMPIDPEDIKRIENDFSINYSEAVFEMDSTP